MNELFSVSQDGLRTGSGTKSAPQTRAASLREAPESDSHQDGYAYSLLPPPFSALAMVWAPSLVLHRCVGDTSKAARNLAVKK
jgi:hypothetical protein